MTKLGSVPVVRRTPNTAPRIMRIGSKLYDFGTRNRTFLQVASDLKKLGIKNCYFMLEVVDPRVVTIDPFAVDKDGHSILTKEQVSIVMAETKVNPWYYLREISRIPAQGGQGSPYKANRGNIAQAWCIIHGYDSWLCLPRQKGKTQSALAIQLWAYSFGTSNSEFIFINKDGDNAKMNLRRMKDQMELLPEYMRFPWFIDENGNKIKHTMNATSMKHPVTKNIITVKPKATSYEAALSLARGLTSPIQHFDEPEFTNQIDTIISNSYSTFETAARNSKENGGMYGRIFTWKRVAIWVTIWSVLSYAGTSHVDYQLRRPYENMVTFND